EIWTDAARSVRETAPYFLSVRRICFFVDENPTSSPPEETSARSAIVCLQERRDIIYLCVYKIDPRCFHSMRTPKTIPRSNARSGLGRGRRWRHRRGFAPPASHEQEDEEDRRDDRDPTDERNEGAVRPGGGARKLKVRLYVRRDGRIVDHGGPTSEAEPGEEDETDEPVSILTNRGEAES